MRTMIRSLSVLAVAGLALGGCAGSAIKAKDIPAGSPKEALRSYYNALSTLELPIAPKGPAINASQSVTRLVVGSCIDEEKDAPLLGKMAQEDAGLTLLVGDNVYGDKDGFFHENNDPLLEELRESYADLRDKPEFVALRAARPMMAIWDDHDYGANDAGGDFPFKEFAERIHETFWGASAGDAADHPGVYTSMMMGPVGQRMQVILLDTRYFRSPLKKTDAYGAAGKQRYVPTDDPYQSMLGEVQWRWLAEQLDKPADLRLVVSSIQITPDVHGWEKWGNMPNERERLYDLLAEKGVELNTVFVSGDRHSAFIYNNTQTRGEPIAELTTSSVNLPFSKTEIPNEEDPLQTTPGYAWANYGVIDIDWDARRISLQIKDKNAEIVRESKKYF